LLGREIYRFALIQMNTHSAELQILGGNHFVWFPFQKFQYIKDITLVVWYYKKIKFYYLIIYRKY